MRILAVLLVLISTVSCEKISSLFGDSQNTETLFTEVEGMYAAYNKKELDVYCSYFTDGINVFKEQGLGNTRIVAGKDDFRRYYEKIFRAKKRIKVTPLSHFSVYPWLMVKELIEQDEQVFEAAVGYRIEAGKIRDRMILSENFLVNKEKLSIELPKEKSPEIQLPPPHLTQEEFPQKKAKDLIKDALKNIGDQPTEKSVK